MTANQIAYINAMEAQRANKAREELSAEQNQLTRVMNDARIDEIVQKLAQRERELDLAEDKQAADLGLIEVRRIGEDLNNLLKQQELGDTSVLYKYLQGATSTGGGFSNSKTNAYDTRSILFQELRDALGVLPNWTPKLIN